MSNYDTNHDHGQGRDLGSMMNDKKQIKEDLVKARRYVKEDLFYQIILIVKRREQVLLSQEGRLYKHFTLKCLKQVSDGRLLQMNSEDQNAYMGKLWNDMVQGKKIKEWLSAKRSNCYTACQHRFNGK